MCLRWDDEPYFIFIQVFIAVIRGWQAACKPEGPPMSTTLTVITRTVCRSRPHRSECPGCDVCPAPSRPCWRHPAHSPATSPSSSPKAPRPDRTRTRTPPQLKGRTAETCGEWGSRPLRLTFTRAAELVSNKTGLYLLALSVCLWFSPAGMALEDLRGSRVTPAPFKFDALSARLPVLLCGNVNRPWLEIVCIMAWIAYTIKNQMVHIRVNVINTVM